MLKALSHKVKKLHAEFTHNLLVSLDAVWGRILCKLGVNGALDLDCDLVLCPMRVVLGQTLILISCLLLDPLATQVILSIELGELLA